MNLTKILTIVFVLISLGMAYFLFDSIRQDIVEEKRIAAIEAQIINKLEIIRDAEIAYRSVRGNYTSDWDKLLSFIDTGRIYITERHERIITLDYGADSVIVNIDTLGTVRVQDSLFSEEDYPNFDLETIPIIPGSGKKFELYANEIDKNGVMVDVFEARDVDPINPERRDGKGRGALRVGSKTEVTTRGNWE